MTTLSNIINKTEFIKTCSIASFIFTGSAAVIACISCYITLENYKITKETRKLIKQLLHDNNKINELKISKIMETNAREIIVVPDKIASLIVDEEKKCILETVKIEDPLKTLKHEKDYLDMFEEYYDVVPDNSEKKSFSLYKLFGMV